MPDNERRAFLFENIIDSKGKQYDSPTLVGGLAASTDIYSLGLNCEPKDIAERWTNAKSNGIEPVVVNNSPWKRGELTSARVIISLLGFASLTARLCKSGYYECCSNIG